MSNMITARALALKVSTRTMEDLAIAGEANAEAKRGPLMAMFDFREDFGDDMTNVPDMDTENEEGKPAAYASPEWFQKPSFNATTGATTKTRVSYFWEVADNTTTGKPIAIGERPRVVGGIEIQAILDWITSKMGDDTYLDKAGLKQERGYWSQRKSDNRKFVRKAFAIDQRDREITSKLPKLRVVFLKDAARDADGKVIEGQFVPTTSKSCIKVEERDNVHKYWIGSYGTFLSWDVDMAKANGGTLEDLIATGGRDGNADVTQGQLPALAFKDLESVCIRVKALLDQDDMDKVIKRRASDKQTGDIFAWNLYELYLAMGAACSSLEPQWLAVNKQNDEADAKARAERVARQPTA